MNSIIKKPSAWIPIVLSLIVVAAWCIGFATVGVPAREADGTCIGTCGRPDEGTGAHLFQIWLVLEALMMAFFTIRWLPQRPMQALFVLATQIVAVLAACFPVFYFKL